MRHEVHGSTRHNAGALKPITDAFARSLAEPDSHLNTDKAITGTAGSQKEVPELATLATPRDGYGRQVLERAQAAHHDLDLVQVAAGRVCREHQFHFGRFQAGSGQPRQAADRQLREKAPPKHHTAATDS